MRRRVGLGAIQKKKLTDERYKDKGSEIQVIQLEEMTKLLDTFRSKLEEFANAHKQDIKKDAAFRKHFHEMCASIGVDPLASRKGFWSEMLGVGDFYYELGVQIVEVCMAAAHRTGGLMELDELCQKVIKSRGGKSNQEIITNDDILRAIKKLKVLGNGFTVIMLGSGRYLVQSVPGEFSMDQTLVLQKAEENKGFVTINYLRNSLGWEEPRSHRAVDLLIKEGLAWIDEQSKEKSFWIPSIFTNLA